MKTTSKKVKIKNEDDLKNDVNLKNKYNLKNEDDLTNWNEDDLIILYNMTTLKLNGQTN